MNAHESRRRLAGEGRGEDDERRIELFAPRRSGKTWFSNGPGARVRSGLFASRRGVAAWVHANTVPSRRRDASCQSRGGLVIARKYLAITIVYRDFFRDPSAGSWS
jgi:hypothetical protein